MVHFLSSILSPDKEMEEEERVSTVEALRLDNELIFGAPWY